MTTLMIKTHNVTGLKYFCKSQKEDKELENYLGSGKYWIRHIKKHGRDIKTEIYAQFEDDNPLLVETALKFSEENNIVESKEWANLQYENGIDGNVKGNKHSKESIQKMKDNTIISKEQLEKQRNLQRELITCDICNKTVNRFNFYRYHGDKCKDSNEFKKCSCIKCQKEIGINNIKSHTDKCYDNISVVSEKKRSCSKCNKEFSVYGINQHERSCGVETPNIIKIKKSSSCLICKREITNANIERHLNSHLS